MCVSCHVACRSCRVVCSGNARYLEVVASQRAVLGTGNDAIGNRLVPNETGYHVTVPDHRAQRDEGLIAIPVIVHACAVFAMKSRISAQRNSGVECKEQRLEE